MVTLRTKVLVLPDGSVEVPGRTTLPPGEHEAVIVIEEAPAAALEARRGRLESLPFRSGGEWLDKVSLRREDLYGDDGR
ncbi:MAG TPA: hypothetical protein VFG43_13790 [Geminicoccaceae bacterium]|nr:hypothetical protein [Geminicoccaceae bacterium]